MDVTTPLSDVLGEYLNLSSRQLKLTAQNMANIDTPGYRTVGFDFAGAMQQSMSEVLKGRETGDAGTNLAPFGVPNTSSQADEVDGLLERPDGNNVSMDREGLQMAEAQLKFRTGVELLKREFSRVLDAIHAGQS